MNFISKKILLVLALLGCSGSAFGYVWTFTNITDEPILIELRLLAWGYIYYDIVNPGQNSTRFEWPMGSVKAGFCIDKFFIGTLDAQALKDIFGDAENPRAEEIARVCSDANNRVKLARIGKSEPSIRWVSGQKWGTFDQISKDAVNALSESVGDLAGESTNLAVAAGAETATGGTTAGAAGTLAAKLDLGRIFDLLSSIPGSIMDLAHKSPCASRQFDIIKDESGNLIAVTKD